MSIHVVAPTAGITRVTCAHSPRIALVTDTGADEPPALAEIAESVISGDLSAIGKGNVPAGFDGALIWCRGEAALGGTPAEWRRAFLMEPACDTWVVLHWPGVEHADFLGIEPRGRMAGAKRTVRNPLLRVAGVRPSPKMKTAWRESGEPWARHSMALWQEYEQPGASIEMLRGLWQSKKLESALSALVLRNLVVALLGKQEWDKAEELLGLGQKAFPGYRELGYVNAVASILQNKPSRAIKHLESAMKPGDREFVSSGGECTYRARYLLGTICEAVGQQEKAMNFWLPCLNERPAFEPAVRTFLGQQIPRARAAHLQQPLGELARREPRYLEPVLNFMLGHGMLFPARRLAETAVMPPAQRARYLDAIHRFEQKRVPRASGTAAKPGIVLSGPLLDASGHARINREIALALLKSPQFDAALDPTTWPAFPLEAVREGQAIWRGIQREPEHLDLTIRHQWPPDFRRPQSGKLACILPWEHSAVPKAWVREIESNVDELWTPSEFVRRSFVSGGVPADRVRLLPNAVDDETFTPEGPRTRWPGSHGFVFLFVGGPIRRKGIDLLLQAYGDGFSPEDDVTLLVKDLGSRSFYGGITRLHEVRQFAERSANPHTVVIEEEMGDAALAALYRGANALVLPYRGEGFGMPLVEAMACGKPIIATGQGPAAEFCPADAGYLLPAREVPVPEAPPPLGEFTSERTWFEPDAGALARAMRQAYENPEEAAVRGRRAAASIRDTLTWKRVLPIYLERIAELTGVAPAAVPAFAMSQENG